MKLFFDFCELCFDFLGTTLGIVLLLILAPTILLLVLAVLPLFAVAGFFVAIFRALFGTRESQGNLR